MSAHNLSSDPGSKCESAKAYKLCAQSEDNPLEAVTRQRAVSVAAKR